MKEKELRENSKCSFCGKGVATAGILFWRIKIERFGLDLQALQRQQGLGMMLGGHGGLAMVMGPDEDMAQSLIDPVTLIVCQACEMKSHPIASLPEFLPEKSEKQK